MINLAVLADLRRSIDVKETASETLATRHQFAAQMQARAVDGFSTFVSLQLKEWLNGLDRDCALAGC